MQPKSVTAIAILLLMLISLSVSGCTSSNNSNQAATSTPNASTTTTANATKNVTAAVKAKPTATPTTPTPKPSASNLQPQHSATFHNYGYHVNIYGQCVPAGCSMTDSYMAGYEDYWKGNLRVTYSIAMKHCGPSYNAPNCTSNDVFVEVKVLETGQVAHFDVDNRENVIPFVDNVLNAGYWA